MLDWVPLLRARASDALAQLPLITRAIEAELHRLADDDGRIFLAGRSAWEAIARLGGADVGDRRLLRAQMPKLEEAGLVVVDGGYLQLTRRSKNTPSDEQAPRPRRSATPPRQLPIVESTPPPEHEPTTSEDRTSAESETTESRAGHEPERVGREPVTNRNESVASESRVGGESVAKSELSARTHSARDPEEEKRGEENRSTPQPPGVPPPAVGGSEGGGSGVAGAGPGTETYQPPVKLTAVGQAVLAAFAGSENLKDIATAEFASRMVRYIDESGQMPGGRDLADVEHAIRQADEVVGRDQAIGEARNKRALAGLVVAKIKESKRGDADRAKRLPAPEGDERFIYDAPPKPAAPAGAVKPRPIADQWLADKSPRTSTGGTT